MPFEANKSRMSCLFMSFLIFNVFQITICDKLTVIKYLNFSVEYVIQKFRIQMMKKSVRMSHSMSIVNQMFITMYVLNISRNIYSLKKKNTIKH